MKICNLIEYIERIGSENHTELTRKLGRLFEDDIFATPDLSLDQVNEVIKCAGMTFAHLEETPFGCSDIVIGTDSYPTTPGVLKYTTDLNPIPSNNTINVKTFNGKKKGVFVSIMQRVLQPVIQKDIEFYVPHGKVVNYAENPDKFRIYVWSASSSNDDRRRPPSKLFGIRIGCDDGAFIPKQQSVFSTIISNSDNAQILIKDGDYVVAELYKDALYITHDIVHYGTENEFELFAEILAQAAKILNKEHFDKLTENSRSEIEHIQEKITEEKMCGIIKAYTKRLAESKERSETDLIKKINKLSEKFAVLARELKAVQNGMPSYKDAMSELKKQISDIQEHVRVDNVDWSVTDSGKLKIEVETHHIVMKNNQDNTYHLLEPLKITLLPMERSAVKSGGLTISTCSGNSVRNGDRGVFYAPHMPTHSTMCLGTLAKDIELHFGNWNFFAMVSLIIALFEVGVDPTDQWGSAIYKFPTIKEKNLSKYGY